MRCKYLLFKINVNFKKGTNFIFGANFIFLWHTFIYVTSKFMNKSEGNKYEVYIKSKVWNLTPNGPAPLTHYITVEDTINFLRLIYSNGETEEGVPDNGQLLLPRNWGNENREVVHWYIQEEKIQPNHRIDLEMHTI